MKSFCIGGAMVLTVAVAPGVAQERDPDSLVARFVEHGLGPAGWYPSEAFRGCPDLVPWQREVFRRLISADLTPRRNGDLGLSLGVALDSCADAELEAWYFGEMERNAAKGEYYLHPYWMGMEYTDNSTVGDRLYAWMTDDALDPGFRQRAAGIYLQKLEEKERLPALVAHYESRTIPDDWAGTVLRLAVRRDPEYALSAAGRLVREQPGRFLADPQFQLFLTPTVLRFASSDVRARFLADVRAAMDAYTALDGELQRQLLYLLAKVEDPG